MTQKQCSVRDLPLYLCPQFKLRTPSFMLIQWSGVDMVHRTVTLRMEFPIQEKKRMFTSFKECIDFLAEPTQTQLPPHYDCFIAFSYETILPFMQLFFRNPNNTALIESAYKTKYPLKTLFETLESVLPPPVYNFRPCGKQLCVAKINRFIKSFGSGGENDEKDEEENSSREIEDKHDWKKKEYFGRVHYRMRTKCQFDPKLVRITSWLPQVNGGYDITFLCEFVQQENQNEIITHWVHYLQLQINPTYKSILDTYIQSMPKITEYIQSTTI